MFGMSMTELGMILVVILIFMGPEKIPDAARMMGKMMREVRKASNLLRDAVMIDLDEKPKPVRPVPLAEKEKNLVGVHQAKLRDPDPKLDVRVVKMNPSGAPQGVTEMLIAAAQLAEPHREIYLHVPYDETI